MAVIIRALDRAPSAPASIMGSEGIVEYRELEKVAQFVVDAYSWAYNPGVRADTIMRMNYQITDLVRRSDFAGFGELYGYVEERVKFTEHFGAILKNRMVDFRDIWVPDPVFEAFANEWRRQVGGGVRLPEGGSQTSDPREGIANYSADVLQFVRGNRSGDGFFPEKEVIGDKGLWLGVELEVEFKAPKWAGIIMDMTQNGDSPFKNYAICKHDGSIQGGFEIVTAPSTFEWLRDEGIWYKWAKRYGPYVTGEDTGGRAGMHVHVSKDWFRKRPLTGSKLKVFLNGDERWGNYKEHQKFIQSVAGRGENRYAGYSSGKVAEGFFDVENLGSRNRNSVLNTSKRDTYEFRLFKSSSDAKIVMKNICFVQAAVEFCQVSSMKALDYLAFLDWVQGQEERFPELCQFLKFKGHLGGSPDVRFGEAVTYSNVRIVQETGSPDPAVIAQSVQVPFNHLRV